MTALHHVNVMVDDLDTAITFYRDVIGLRPRETPPMDFPAQFFTIAPDQELHVNELEDTRAVRAHFCLRVDDLLAVVDRAASVGAIDEETWGPACRLPSGVIQLFVRDPAGNLVELNSTPGDELDLAAFEQLRRPDR